EVDPVFPDRDSDQADETSGRWPDLVDNLLPPILGLIGIGALACGVWALGQGGAPEIDAKSCAAVVDERPRLACFDKLAAPRHPPMGALVPPLAHTQDGH